MTNDKTSLMTDLAIATIVEAACIKKPVMPDPVLMVTANNNTKHSKRTFFMIIVIRAQI